MIIDVPQEREHIGERTVDVPRSHIVKVKEMREMIMDNSQERISERIGTQIEDVAVAQTMANHGELSQPVPCHRSRRKS